MALRSDARPLAAKEDARLIYLRQYSDRVAEVTLLIDALTNVRGDLDSLFAKPGARVPVAQAGSFVLEHFKTQAAADLDAARRDKTAAAGAVAGYLKDRGLEKGDMDDPAYEDLRKAELATDVAVRFALRHVNRIMMAGYSIAEETSESPPDRQFPTYAKPLPIYDVRVVSPSPGDPLTGPGPSLSVMGALRNLQDAVTRKRRANASVIEEQRCAFVVTDDDGAPAPQKLCVAVIALPIDYDLTGEDCGPASIANVPLNELVLDGTRMAPGACKESWTFPHLNVVYELGKFTVYASRPVGIAADDSIDAPLSEWHVTWHGTEKPLTPSATFEWDGTRKILRELSLRHDVLSQVRGARIWRDLRLGRGGQSVDDTITGASQREIHAFAPVVIDNIALFNQLEMAPAIMALGIEDAELVAMGGWQMAPLRRELSAHQALVNDIARLTPPQSPQDESSLGQTGGLATRCDYYRHALGSQRKADMLAQVRGAVNSAPVHPCEAIHGYGAILDSLERGTFTGSWHWMLVTP